MAPHEKTCDELAQELASTCEELDRAEDERDTAHAILAGIAQRHGGLYRIPENEIPDEGEIAIGTVDGVVTVLVPGAGMDA